MNPRRVMIVAGETSGDYHAANVVREALAREPGLHFYGIAGEAMRAAGVEALVDSREMAVMGLAEVLAHYPRLRRILSMLRRRLQQDRPALLLLVDYPEFNLMLAQTAKALGIPVLFYISPQVWAWRRHRVKRIRHLVDMMAVVFPFEVPFYEDAGVPVRFVGHPLAQEVRCDLSREEAKRTLGLDPQRPLLGLFPGSRRSEVQRLLPTQLAAAALLYAERPQLQFALPLASGLDDTDVGPHLERAGLPVQVVKGRPREVMRACDAIVTASGTATLEIALIGTPLVVIYKVAPLSYFFMSRMIKVPHIALCNIVAGERVAPELVQHAATPEAIAGELRRLLDDADAAARQRVGLATVKAKLGEGGGAADVAALTLTLLER